MPRLRAGRGRADERTIRRRLVHSTLNVMGAAVRTYLNLREHRSAIAAREHPTQIEQQVLRPLVPGSVAIAATYPQGLVEDGFISMLEEFAERGAQVLVVSTAPLGAELAARLRPFASVTLQIANIGRDIGAYQRGIA
jgi:hypothetical protein